MASVNEFLDEMIGDNTRSLATVVVDCETSRNDEEGGPWPFSTANHIVRVGWKVNGEAIKIGFAADFLTAMDKLISEIGYAGIILVGFNIKFDYHYLVLAGLSPAIVDSLIDLSLRTHYASGCSKLFPTLDEAAEFYGLGVSKETEVKELWDKGARTEDIPLEILDKYLKKDVAITDTISATAWSSEAARSDCSLLNRDRQVTGTSIGSLATKALAEIERNGMYVDLVEVNKRIDRLTHEIEAHEESMRECGEVLFGEDFKFVESVTSSKVITCIAHGSPTIEVTKKLPAGTYKNGKPKFAKSKVALTQAHPWCITSSSAFSNAIDADTLASVINDLRAFRGRINASHVARQDYLTDYGNLKLKQKLLKTYYMPIFNRTLRARDVKLHASLHEVGTNTGRTSSSKPNIQNIPGEVRSVVKSRYTNGKILSCDFSQLEVCGIAQLSKDRKLIEDLCNDVDIHTEANGGVRGTPEERRNVKGVVFGSFYGGGVNTLSTQTGLPSKRVKEIRDNLKRRYPDAMGFHSVVKSELTGSMKATSTIIGGQVVYSGTFYLPTGRRLTFEQKPNFGGSLEWPHTECCDRPIQAISTGDLSKAFLASIQLFMDRFDTEGWFKGVKLINFIHDEVVMDIPGGADLEAIKGALTFLAEQVMPELWSEWTGSPWLTPLKLNISVTDTWTK